MKILKSKNRPAFTLVELLVTILAAMIVIMASAVILIFGQNSLDTEWRKVNFQREASYAMLRIRQAVRCASNAELEDDGNTIKIYNNSGWIKYKFDPDRKNLLYQFEDEDEQILLEGVVESVTFKIDPVSKNAVTFGIDLKNDDLESRNSSKVMMRNYGT
jgi:type II secretory pathway pseudopilin PulG